VEGGIGEHPFWVRGKGWLQADQMIAGDHLVGHDHRWAVVDAVERTEEYQTVYNLRVADSHTSRPLSRLPTTCGRRRAP
jgi:intein/homing endonuclease